MPIFGIDVSKMNGGIDHRAVKGAGARFAMVRATKGLTSDSRFEYNALGFQKAGVPIGAYHTFTAMTVAQACSEAQHFIDTLTGQRQRIALPLVCHVDTEDSPSVKALGGGALTSLIGVFLSCVRSSGYEVCVFAKKELLYEDIDLRMLNALIWQDGGESSVDGIPGELAMHRYTHSGQLVGVVGEFGCSFAYAPISRIIIKSRTDITDDVLDYIESYGRGEYVLARIADMLVARSIKPLRNPSYERIVPLIRLSCRLTYEDAAHICAYRWGNELIHELYEAMLG